MSDDTLFDTAVPEDEVGEDDDDEDESAEGSQETIEQMLEQSTAINEADPFSEWEKDGNPFSHTFKATGRLKLMAFAMEEVMKGDPVYRNKSSTSRQADVSRHSAHRHIDYLVELGIFKTRGESFDRYRPNKNSRILKAMALLAEEIMERDNDLDEAELAEPE